MILFLILFCKLTRTGKSGSKIAISFKYYVFLYFQEHLHMRDIVVLEVMDDMDTDKDGRLSLDEFIGDLWQVVATRYYFASLVIRSAERY